MSYYHSLAHKLWYAGCRGLCQIVAVTFFGIRSFGRENVPAKGGALLASNHQSFLDPTVVGLCLTRQVHYLARDSLFRRTPSPGSFVQSMPSPSNVTLPIWALSKNLFVGSKTTNCSCSSAKAREHATGVLPPYSPARP